MQNEIIPAVLKAPVEQILANTKQKLEELLMMNVEVSFKATKEPVNHHYIGHLVCNHFGIEFKMLFEKGRTQNVATARQMYCYLCRRFCNMSYGSIAKTINRDHTTVMFSMRTITNYLEQKDAYVTVNLQHLIIHLISLQNEKLSNQA